MKNKDITLAGIKLYTDEKVPIDHARYGSGTRAGVRRFTAFQRALLASPSAKPGVLAGRLVALDLVSVHDLQRALAAQPFVFRGEACIEWMSGEWLDRRQLCLMTVLSLDGPREAEAELAALREIAAAVPGYESSKQKKKDILQQLELDRIAWASERIQKALWSHVASARRFTLLPRLDLANERADQVPELQLDPLLSEQQAQMADLIDACVGNGAKRDTMPAVVKLATEAFSMASGKSDPETLRDWGKALLGLRPHIETADAASAVVVGWNYLVVMNGTSTEPDAALATRARYVRVANRPLWRVVANLPTQLEDWTPALVRAGLTSAMLDPACKDKKGLGAAISSFVQYLEEEFGVEVSVAGLHELIPDSKPRAKWVAPTAVARAIGWLTAADKGDPRLLAIASVMLQLASIKPFRISELRWTRIGNIHFPDVGGVEVEITPLAGHNPLKTDAATRRISIAEGAACEALRAWVTKRIDEGAPASAYVFGEPDQDEKLYRPHAVHTLLLEILKRATGDAEVTFHSLRHTVITNEVEAILLLNEPGFVNRFAAMADPAGHVVAATSFEHYAHRIESPLRQAIDRELKLLELTNADGECILGIKANTLTQAARRSDVELATHIWDVATRRAQQITVRLPDVAEGMTWTDPKPPIFTGPVARAFTVKRCLVALEAMAKHTSATLIEHRHGLDGEGQGQLVNAALEVVAEIYAKRRKLPPADCNSVATAFALLNLDVERTEQPRYQSFMDFASLPQDPVLLQAAACAWTDLWWDGEICATEPMSLIPLLKLLQQAGVPPENLLLCREPEAQDPQGVERYRAAADLVSFSVFNQRIQVEPLSVARPGRASAYLLWTSGPEVGAAGKSNAGFDALMFTLAVWARPSLGAWR
ncbi:hypothetical protein D621_15920 [beta proteobacterium AAP51]|nr:hypothetical protein D621_15920 [beta proteobacterium AAP51]